MAKKKKSYDELLAEVADLRGKLDETRETLDAIREGKIDAVLVSTPNGDKLYTLEGADYTSRILLEQMPEGAIIIDSNGLIIYGNKYLEQLLKCPLEKITGEYLYNFLSSSDRVFFDSLMKQSPDLNTNGELHILAKDGSIVPVLLSITLTQIDREIFYFIIMTDMTKQKLNEEERIRDYKKIKQIFNAATSGICVIDLNGIITQVNDPFLRMIDIDEMNVIGKKCDVVLNHNICGTYECPIGKIIAGAERCTHEFGKISSNSIKKNFSVMTVPLIDINDNITGIIKCFTDITERWELESKVRSQMETERQKLSYDLHESLAQTLAGVNFQLESIRMNLKNNPHYVIENVSNVIEHIQKVTSQAREMARNIYPVNDNPEGFMNALTEFARAVLKKSGVNCVINTNENIAFHNNGKANYLFNIIKECVNNSINNINAKNIELNLNINDGHLSVVISDDGIWEPHQDKKNHEIDFELMKFRVNAIDGTFEINYNLNGSCQIKINQISHM